MVEISKIKACILGLALADAVGVPVEFFERDELDDYPVEDMREYGTHHVPYGTWSDDTSMTIAALDSLKSGKLDYTEIMRNFIAWADTGKYTTDGNVFDIGMTCYMALSRFRMGELPLQCGGDSPDSNGNGSLMRIAPFSIFAKYRCSSDAEMKELIFNASSLTHAHIIAKMGCVIYTCVLSALLDNPQKNSIYDGIEKAKVLLLNEEKFSVYHRIFEHDFSKINRDDIKSGGYVVDTLEAALWCLLNTNSYEECVLKAVNLGKDTDTVAAVAGSMAGVLYSYDGIKKDWLDKLLRRDDIESLCTEFCNNL